MVQKVRGSEVVQRAGAGAGAGTGAVVPVCRCRGRCRGADMEVVATNGSKNHTDKKRIHTPPKAKA